MEETPATLIVGTEALATGAVTRRELGRSFVKVHRNIYTRLSTELTAADHARAAWLWSGRQATLVGHSAGAILGSKWLPPEGPAELGRLRRPGARHRGCAAV